jgi:hypothetical protein
MTATEPQTSLRIIKVTYSFEGDLAVEVHTLGD